MLNVYIYIYKYYISYYIYVYSKTKLLHYWILNKKMFVQCELVICKAYCYRKGSSWQKIHFQLLKHAYSGLKYEIQSKAFSETSSENSSTGNGIRMYTWHLSLWKIWILTAGEFVKRSHKGTCTLMIWKSRGGRFLHTGSVYNPVISGSIDKPSLPG